MHAIFHERIKTDLLLWRCSQIYDSSVFQTPQRLIFRVIMCKSQKAKVNSGGIRMDVLGYLPLPLRQRGGQKKLPDRPD